MAAERSPETVVFIPDGQKFNPYQSRLAEALTHHGYKVIIKDPLPLLGAFTRLQQHYGRCTIVHLHWVNGLINQATFASSDIKFLTWYSIIFVDLIIFRLCGGKLFWTIHNLISHECPNPKRERSIRRLIARFANGIHLHSQSAISLVEQHYTISLRSKAVITAHASYVDDYPSNSSRSELLAKEAAITHDSFTFLFFGSIRRYKGLESLVESFSQLQGSHYRLLIVGAPHDGCSLEWLKEASGRDPRVKTYFGYVSSLEVSSFFDISNVLVAPYSATLTSGVVSLGLTFGIPMVLPDAAKIYDLPGEDGAEYFRPGGLSAALSRIEKRDLALMRGYNTELGQSLTWDSMARVLTMAYHHAGQGN